jgi:hypothetical protein
MAVGFVSDMCICMRKKRLIPYEKDMMTPTHPVACGKRNYGETMREILRIEFT